jgi:predicted small lipoprotein YifL
MRMPTHRSVSIFILIGAIAASLSLAACGRKSGLDLPPSASVAPAPAETKSAVISPIGKPPKPEPRVVPQRSLPIDVLLN